jgi:hypothetical protein
MRGYEVFYTTLIETSLWIAMDPQERGRVVEGMVEVFIIFRKEVQSVSFLLTFFSYY